MINFKFPDVGEGIHEGQILKWNFDIGDEVEEGETLCVVETDKVNAEMPAPEDGILKKKGAEVGETIHVGDILAVIDDGEGGEAAEEPEAASSDTEEEDDDVDENVPEEKKSDENASVVGSIESSDEVLPASDEHTAQKSTKKSSGKALATPVARKLAKDLGVDINTLEGSGPAGRVMKEDIRAAAGESGNAQPQAQKQPSGATMERPSMPQIPEEGTRREKISKLRKSAVKAMDTSNQVIPATTIMDEIDVSDLAKFRREQKDLAKDQDAKLTFLPLIIKAVILTLKDYPIFNSSFDHESDEIVYKDFINMGIAVDTPDGLIVPNIKDADKKSIFELSREVDRLAKAARERTIQLSELRNTTFSVTNYGAFGSKLGTPVINHPEVAILGMGAIEKKPVVRNDEIVAREIFPVSLTIDHRIIDGGDGGRFLVQLKKYLQNPMLLLLS
jgi:pyruvate dehydrogenase E2 component (dihydrolipoamide acetyltransferase)